MDLFVNFFIYCLCPVEHLDFEWSYICAVDFVDGKRTEMILPNFIHAYVVDENDFIIIIVLNFLPQVCKIFWCLTRTCHVLTMNNLV